MNKGVFVSLEGGEGSGKSTVLSLLQEKFSEAVITREPGGTKIAEQIRNIILDVNNTKMNSKTEALLYAASRSQHVSEIIKPALEKNLLVICDRYVDSSIVYQGVARGNNLEDIWAINNFAIDGIIPDLTIFFDITPEAAFTRLEKRSLDRLDLESSEFHNKVYDAYLELSLEDRFIKVDASKPLEEVVQDCYNIINNYIKEYCG